MQIQVDTSGALPVITVSGNMRLGEIEGRSDRLRQALLDVFKHGSRAVLDLSAVNDIDSQGIGCIARCLATAISHKGDLQIVVSAGSVQQALAQVNLLSVFPTRQKAPPA